MNRRMTDGDYRVDAVTAEKARYFRFTATHSVASNDRVAVAEVDVW